MICFVEGDGGLRLDRFEKMPRGRPAIGSITHVGQSYQHRSVLPTPSTRRSTGCRRRTIRWSEVSPPPFSAATKNPIADETPTDGIIQSSTDFKIWPQPVCLVLTIPSSHSVPERLSGIAGDAREIIFDDFSEEGIVQILLKMMESQNMSAGAVKQDSLLK